MQSCAIYRPQAEFDQQFVLAGVHALEVTRGMVVVSGQMQEAVDEIEGKFLPSRPAGAAAGGGSLPRYVGTQDDFRFQVTCVAITAQVEREYIAWAGDVHETPVQGCHRPGTHDGDGQIPTTKALRGGGVTSHSA